jgi:DNA-binding NarL/FixJ family response regulator
MPDIHIVVITSNSLNRSGIESLIAKAQEGVKILASFADLLSVEQFLKDNRVDILIIDDTLPRSIDIGSVIRKLVTLHPNLGILMVAGRPMVSLVRRVLDCGARGFLHKDDAMDVTLLEAIHGMRKGGLYLSRRVNQLFQVQRRLPDKITGRDLDVLHLTAEGFEVKEISAQIGVTDKTVYRILAGLREFYGAQNNTNLINIVYHAKLLPTNDSSDDE